MRLLYVADGRSPITLRWMNYFINSAHEVHLASTYPCEPIPGLASLQIIPVGMSEVYGQPGVRNSVPGTLLRKILPVQLRTRIRQVLAPSSFTRAVRFLAEVINHVQPDLIHAMRIPYEGMIASMACSRIDQGTMGVGRPKLLISVWGNDFTLHAKSTAKLTAYTSSALKICDGLHTDCHRDLKLAIQLGYAPNKPAIVLPGGGGIDLHIFHPPEITNCNNESLRQVTESMIKVINPRGFRAYVRNDTFFKAIPSVISHHPDVKFICTDMSGEAQANRWIKQLGLGRYVELLPFQSQGAMADLFRRAQISLSITTHDGTPNTLLEAMACGCFPIAGDIESIREWITPGVNGLLIDPDNPAFLADAILQAISQPELRRRAADKNIEIVREGAEYHQTMRAADEFYRQLIAK